MELAIARELELVVVDVADGRPVEDARAVSVHGRCCERSTRCRDARLRRRRADRKRRQRNNCRDGSPAEPAPVMDGAHPSRTIGRGRTSYYVRKAGFG